MTQTCDRCGPAVRAAYRVDRSGELYLCGHCLDIFWPALLAQGWNIRRVRPRLERVTPAPRWRRRERC